MLNSIKSWAGDCWRLWTQFWFRPAEPHTLALIRILGGAMLFYTHLIWTLGLDDFLGRNSFITGDVSQLCIVITSFGHIFGTSNLPPPCGCYTWAR